MYKLNHRHSGEAADFLQPNGDVVPGGVVDDLQRTSLGARSSSRGPPGGALKEPLMDTHGEHDPYARFHTGSPKKKSWCARICCCFTSNGCNKANHEQVGEGKDGVDYTKI